MLLIFSQVWESEVLGDLSSIPAAESVVRMGEILREGKIALHSPFLFSFTNTELSVWGLWSRQSQTDSSWSVEWFDRPSRGGTSALNHRKLEVCIKCSWLNCFGFYKHHKAFFFSILRLIRTYRLICSSCPCAKGHLSLLSPKSELGLCNGLLTPSPKLSPCLIAIEFSYLDFPHYRINSYYIEMIPVWMKSLNLPEYID